MIAKYTELSKARVDLRRAIPLAKPFAILFEPASICNFRCRFCFFSEPDIDAHLAKGKMRFDDFTKIVDDLAAWPGERIKVIRIIGFGEPLANRETPRMIAYLKERNVAERIEMTTNASLLTEDMAEGLIEAGLDYIRCSIYAARPGGTRAHHRKSDAGRAHPGKHPRPDGGAGASGQTEPVHLREDDRFRQRSL